MPQPDNRRERGAKTQTSQQTVAPQGQMPGKISPISGGAAAAAPVLQIGQQAQIKKTGAELYQAISGVARGVQQGIQNYEKMYEMVSESDYADFETSYLKEKERVKSDPVKMKAWMDTQTYKPNRVTAKRYHTLKADIFQKSYEEQQSDDWASLQRHILSLSPADALEFANNEIGGHEENSYVAKKLYESISTLQGKVAAQTRQFNLDTLHETYKAQNHQIVQQLHDAGFADSTGSEEFKMILAAASLGQATIDTANGSVTMVEDKRSFYLNALPDDMPLILQDAIGNAPLADVGVVAIRASGLPKGILSPNASHGGGITQQQRDIIANQVTTSLGSGSTESTRAAFASLVGEDEDKNYQLLLNVGGTTVKSVVQDKTISTSEKLRRLTNLSVALGLEDENDLWLQQAGITDVSSFEETIGLRNAINGLAVQGGSESLAAAAQMSTTATNRSQIQVIGRRAMNEIVEYAALSGQDVTANVLIPGVPPVIRSLGLEDMQKALEDGPQQLFPVGITIIDPDISDKIPFTMNLTEDGLVTAGTLPGSLKGTPAQVAATVELLKADKEIQLIERVMNGDTGDMGTADLQIATARLAMPDEPRDLINLAFRGDLPPAAFSEDTSKKLADAMINFVFPGDDLQSYIQNGNENDERTQNLKAGLANLYRTQPAFAQAVDTRNPVYGVVMQYGNKLTSLNAAHAVLAMRNGESEVLTVFTGATEKARSMLESGAAIDESTDENTRVVINMAQRTFNEVMKPLGHKPVELRVVMSNPQHEQYSAAVMILDEVGKRYSTEEGLVNMGSLTLEAVQNNVDTVEIPAMLYDKLAPNSHTQNSEGKPTTVEEDIALQIFTALDEDNDVNVPTHQLLDMSKATYDEVMAYLRGEETNPLTREASDFIEKINEDLSKGFYQFNGDTLLNTDTKRNETEFSWQFPDEAKVVEESWENWLLGVADTAIEASASLPLGIVGLGSDLVPNFAATEAERRGVLNLPVRVIEPLAKRINETENKKIVIRTRPAAGSFKSGTNRADEREAQKLERQARNYFNHASVFGGHAPVPFPN